MHSSGLWDDFCHTLVVKMKMLLHAMFLHVDGFSHFLKHDSVCSVPGWGTIAPMTWIGNEPSSRANAVEPADCLILGFTRYNSHDAVGLEEEMVIYRSKMQPAKRENLKNLIFQDLTWYFFYFPVHTKHFVQTSVIVTFLLQLVSLRDWI